MSSIKHIDAGVLNVGYVDNGPTNGRPVILVHGWPYDVHAFDDATPLLTKAGYRVLAPYVRRYGPTRFLSADSSTGAVAAWISSRRSGRSGATRSYPSAAI